MPVLITIPDIRADTWLGADACAGGSQKCIGTTPALKPNPTSASRSTVATAPVESEGDAVYHRSLGRLFGGDYEALEAAIRKETRFIISESPTNPYLRCVDLERIAEIGKRRKVRTVIDSTFGTPINQRPLQYGAL